MTTLDLTDEEDTALIRLLQQTVEDARFLYVPSLAPLKAILAKLELPAPLLEPLPPLRPDQGPSHGQGRRRR
jgi:hypothetical protein